MTNNNDNKKLTILFHPLNAAGHINACIGMAQALAERGHTIHFLMDSSFEGHFFKFGFNEIVLKDKKKSENNDKDQEENPLKVMSQQLNDCGLLANLTPMQKMINDLDNKMFDDLSHRCDVFNDQIKKAIDEHRPDVIVVDNILVEPAILYGTIPWILMISMSPLWHYNSKQLPPPFSGFPTNSDKETWKEFEHFLDNRFYMEVVVRQNEVLRKYNCQEVESINELNRSPYLNLYGYPEELDYQDIVQSPDNFMRIEAFCRKITETFEFPVEFKKKIKPGDKLIYVSLGSMGSYNIELMKRMVDILSKTPHKYIFSKGPLHDEYELADNMWGKEYVPQTSILPLVDLVITHGGNNTVTETFCFGKPMILMPLFGDQWDNAQRVHEKGYGIRLHAHEYTEQELVDSVNLLLNDTKLNQKLRTISEQIQKSNSKEKACIAIEQMVENNRK